MIPFAHSGLEGIMAQRRIGQEAFRFNAKAEGQTNLDALTALIDWSHADLVLSPLYPSAKGGRPGLPWRCSRRSCSRLGMIFPTWGWPRPFPTGRASAAFAALPAMKRHPSAPPSCASAASLPRTVSTAASLMRSRAISKKGRLRTQRHTDRCDDHGLGHQRR